MYIIISGAALLPFILLAVTLVVGGAYVVVDFFFKYWIYFAIVSGVLLLIRTITTAVRNSDEKWQALVYLILEIMRIPLTYLTLVWYANDWITEAHSNILGFIIKTGVEGIFVLFFISMAITLPWFVFGNDDLAEDFPWVLPLVGIVLIMIPLGLRMIVEYVNTGALFPAELFSKMFFT